MSFGLASNRDRIGGVEKEFYQGLIPGLGGSLARLDPCPHGLHDLSSLLLHKRRVGNPPSSLNEFTRRPCGFHVLQVLSPFLLSELLTEDHFERFSARLRTC